MKILVTYKEGPDGDTVTDATVDDANPSFDPIFAGNKDACVGVTIGLTGGVSVEVSAEEICSMIKAGFNL